MISPCSSKKHEAACLISFSHLSPFPLLVLGKASAKAFTQQIGRNRHWQRDLTFQYFANRHKNRKQMHTCFSPKSEPYS